MSKRLLQGVIALFGLGLIQTAQATVIGYQFDLVLEAEHVDLARNAESYIDGRTYRPSDWYLSDTPFGSEMSASLRFNTGVLNDKGAFDVPECDLSGPLTYGCEMLSTPSLFGAPSISAADHSFAGALSCLDFSACHALTKIDLTAGTLIHASDDDGYDLQLGGL